MKWRLNQKADVVLVATGVVCYRTNGVSAVMQRLPSTHERVGSLHERVDSPCR